jgi:CheY-like chemotaxis protein
MRKSREQPESCSGQSTGVPVTGKRVLVIDDEEVIRWLLTDVLTDDGYSVACARNGEEGLLEYSRSRPDVVVTDLMMPGLSGLHVIEAIRRNDVTTPIFVMTGYASIDTAIEAGKLGVADYLMKPLDIDQMRHDIAKALAEPISTESALVRRIEILTRENERLEELNQLHRAGPPLETVSPAEAPELYRKAIASLVHSLRNIYGIQRTLAGLISLRAPQSPDLQKAAALLSDSIEHCGRLMEGARSLIDFGRPLTEQVRINDIVLETARMANGYVTEGVDFAASIELDDVRAAHTRVNRAQVVQVLLEIIANAARSLTPNGSSTKRGEIRLSAGLRGTEVQLSVSDNGPGIPSDMVKTLLVSPVKSTTQGSGLGLYLSNLIVSLMGGRMVVDSLPDRGTTVSVYLPTD